MIAQLTGKVVHRSPDYLILNVHGVGYKVYVPLLTYYKISQDNQEVSLFIHTHLAIDTHRHRGSMDLYGFLTQEEKAVFELLVTVQGVSPRLARNILSGISVENLVEAVSREDVRKLSAIPGVGRKLSERLIMGLKEKLAELASIGRVSMEKMPEIEMTNDAISALLSLGYKKTEAESAVDTASKKIGTDATVEEFLKLSLKILTK